MTSARRGSPVDEAAVAAGGAAPLRFVHPDTTGHEVRFGPAGQPFDPWAETARRRTSRNITTPG